MRATGHQLLHIHVLGPAELTTPAHVRLPVRQPLARALAVRLGLARGEAVADDILIRELWDDADATRPTARLRVLASRLRGALGDHASALERTPAGFSLRAEPVDLIAAESALATIDAVRRTGDQARVFTTAASAIDLWRGPALCDLNGVPFVAVEQQRLQDLQLALRMAWVEAGLVLGRRVSPDLERLVADRPLDERLVGLSALALARSGRQSEALDRLRSLRHQLADELGIDPAPETVALEDDLRGHRPTIPRNSLPTAATSFVGRSHEQAAILAELTRPAPTTSHGDPGVSKTPLTRPAPTTSHGDPGVSKTPLTRPAPTTSHGDPGVGESRLARPALITLLGDPGVGKSRLAQEIAADAVDQGRPVAWLDLAPLRAANNLVTALATAVGHEVVRGTTGDSIARSAELLTGALLVVDNADHLAAEIGSVIDELRSKAVDLSILVTSQHALQLPYERIHRVDPLSAPAAVALFCDRSGVEPSPAVEQICTAVDHLPLGIELAAGLTRTLSVQQLAEQINDRLRPPIRASESRGGGGEGEGDTGDGGGGDGRGGDGGGGDGRGDGDGGGGGGGDPRASLHAVLDLSHELLEPPVRTALRRLSVFIGGCTLEAAEVVVAGNGIRVDEVADLLAELVDRSLVSMDDDERFSLLETVREYGLDRLRASGEEAAVRERHVAWCAGLAKFGEHYARLNQRSSLPAPEAARRLRIEEPNLLAALDWCLRDGHDPGRVSEIVAPLSWYWYHRGMMTQARGWLRDSLATVAPESSERARSLAALAVQTRFSGGYAEARDIGLECVQLYTALGDERGLAIALQGLTLTSLALEDEYTALDYAHQTELLTRRLNFGVILGASLNCSGLGLRQLGHPVEARKMFEEAYAVWSGLSDDQGVVIASGNLGILDFQAGDINAARARGLHSLRTAHGVGYSVGVLDAFGLLASVEAADGRPQLAVRLLAVAQHQREEIGAPLFIADELAALATAWERARSALGPDADRIADEARDLSVNTLATEVLAADDEAADPRGKPGPAS